MFSNSSQMVMFRQEAEPDNMQGYIRLGTLLRLSNTNMGMVLLEQAWVFWLGYLMQQAQWAMVRLRLGRGRKVCWEWMERMIRGRQSQPKLTGQERRTAHAHTVSCSEH